MNKIIFQLGFLAFCIASIVFGANDLPLIDIISRAFIVFVAVVTAVTLIIAGSALFADTSDSHSDRGRSADQQSGGS